MRGSQRRQASARQSEGGRHKLSRDSGAVDSKSEAPVAQGTSNATAKPKRDAFDHINLVILALTLIAVGTYTAFTWRLVKDTEASYTSVQRAFVTVDPIKSVLRTNPDGTRF